MRRYRQQAEAVTPDEGEAPATAPIAPAQQCRRGMSLRRRHADVVASSRRSRTRIFLRRTSTSAAAAVRDDRRYARKDAASAMRAGAAADIAGTAQSGVNGE